MSMTVLGWHHLFYQKWWWQDWLYPISSGEHGAACTGCPYHTWPPTAASRSFPDFKAEVIRYLSGTRNNNPLGGLLQDLDSEGALDWRGEIRASQMKYNRITLRLDTEFVEFYRVTHNPRARYLTKVIIYMRNRNPNRDAPLIMPPIVAPLVQVPHMVMDENVPPPYPVIPPARAPLEERPHFMLAKAVGANDPDNNDEIEIFSNRSLNRPSTLWSLPDFFAFCHIPKHDLHTMAVVTSHSIFHWSFFKGVSYAHLKELGFLAGPAKLIKNALQVIEL
ncbi:hypothetical protein MJO28_004052 [Puccinia striiformis f. sp. tritici]|uniref:Uncharacterized protein n=1 Tax=Puccinia striiformis f. sp. tritici TaxID=168172 RepID=A0ACC0EMY3_9BASI|nr:hypothetical protein MJO28_004052 [Puccinia striiformis f. sp. tritici]